jgi:hypothetical protein
MRRPDEPIGSTAGLKRRMHPIAAIADRPRASDVRRRDVASRLLLAPDDGAARCERREGLEKMNPAARPAFVLTEQ